MTADLAAIRARYDTLAALPATADPAEIALHAAASAADIPALIDYLEHVYAQLGAAEIARDNHAAETARLHRWEVTGA